MLYVNVTTVDGNEVTVLERSFVGQNSYPDWSYATVTIEGLSDFKLVADKVSYTLDSYSAFLDNITVSDKPCPSGNLTYLVYISHLKGNCTFGIYAQRSC